MNINRLTASGLCMIGLTTTILVFSNKIDEGLINWIYLIFFELIGMLLLYNGLDKNKNPVCLEKLSKQTGGNK